MDIVVDGLLHISNISYILGNETELNVTDNVSTNITTKQYDAKVGEKVKWEKNVKIKNKTRKPKVNSKSRQTAEAFYLKGKFYFRTKQYPKAIAQWEKAFRADPSFKKALIDIKRVKKIMK